MGDEALFSKLAGMLGLARRAGKVTFGFDAVLKETVAGRARAVLVSQDASPRTSGKIKEACEGADVKFLVLPLSKEQLGRSIGRDDTAVAAVVDRLFADRIMELAGAGEQKACSQEEKS